MSIEFTIALRQPKSCSILAREKKTNLISDKQLHKTGKQPYRARGVTQSKNKIQNVLKKYNTSSFGVQEPHINSIPLLSTEASK